MKNSRLVLGAVAVASLFLAGCSSSAGGGEDPGIGTAENPTTISFWHPSEHTQKIVDVFEKSHPGIKVDLTIVPSSQPDIAAKLIAAVKAGDAPDVLKAEYQMLPYLVSQGALEPLSHLSIDDGQYRDVVRGLVNFSGQDYGAPEDFTPMMFFYRADLFDEMGLEVPTTWPEYRALAEKVKEIDPDRYLANYNFDSNDIAGWSAQGGADWWAADDEGNWSVGIDDPASVQAADFWTGLIQDKLILNESGTAVNNLLADGAILSWTAGAWAPGIIMNANPDLDGSWRAAPMPVWDESDPGTAVSGGSAIVLGKNSKAQEAAETFIEWFTDSEEGILARWQYSNLLSGSERMDEAPEILEMRPSPIDPEQDYLKLIASQEPQTFSDWGPNSLLMQSTWRDLGPKLSKGEMTPEDGMAALQKAVVDDMKRVGFTVSEAGK